MAEYVDTSEAVWLNILSNSGVISIITGTDLPCCPRPDADPHEKLEMVAAFLENLTTGLKLFKLLERIEQKKAEILSGPHGAEVAAKLRALEAADK